MGTCCRGMRDGVCGYNAGDAMNLSEIIPPCRGICDVHYAGGLCCLSGVMGD